jgi:V8-like Glu-specific endopeptidase
VLRGNSDPAYLGGLFSMTQHRTIRFITTLVSLAAVTVPMLNMPSHAQRRNLNYPKAKLAKGNPRTQLDPTLQNVPAMPQPEVNTRSSRSASAYQEVSKQLQSPQRQTRNAKATPRKKSRIRTLRLAGRNRLARQAKTIIGKDNRIVVTNTTVNPMKSMTKLYMTFPNGKTYMCSGAMVAAKYTLTAGHCVHSQNDGGWATKVEVIPAMDRSYKPYGSAFATNLRSYSGWINYRDSNADMALITLDREIGHTTGWLSYASVDTVNRVNATITGYPGDRDNGWRLYTDSGKISNATATRFAYPIDTAGGQSGRPVYQKSANGSFPISGVHTNGSANGQTNSGVRIDATKFQSLQTWIGSGT